MRIPLVTGAIISTALATLSAGLYLRPPGGLIGFFQARGTALLYALLGVLTYAVAAVALGRLGTARRIVDRPGVFTVALLAPTFILTTQSPWPGALLLWIGIVLVAGLGTAVGYALAANRPPPVAAVAGLAGG